MIPCSIEKLHEIYEESVNKNILSTSTFCLWRKVRLFVFMVMWCVYNIGVSTVYIPMGGKAALSGTFKEDSSQSSPPPFNTCCSELSYAERCALVSPPVAVTPSTLNPEGGHQLSRP